MITLKINNEQLDLYGEDTIVVNSKIKDVRELGVIFTDYSTSFTLPATKTNNKIFKHYYNSEVIVAVDYRLSQSANIELDTVPFRQGQLKLEGIVMKNNKPSSYKVTFFGDGVNLKRAVGDKLLRDLDWSELNHVKTTTVVEDGLGASTQWNDSISEQTVKNDDLIYPLITKNKREWTVANLADGAIISFNEFYPAVKVSKVLERIESTYNLKFNSEFFDSTQFNKLYLWCPVEDNNINSAVNAAGSTVIDFSQVLAIAVLRAGVDISNNSIDLGHYLPVDTHNVNLVITPEPGHEGTPYTIYEEIKINGEWTILSETRFATGGTNNVSETYTYEGNEIRWSIQPDNDMELVGEVKGIIVRGQTVNVYEVGMIAPQIIGDSQYSLKYKIPKLKIIDFLDSIFKLSNMVIVPSGITYVHNAEDPPDVINEISNFYCEPYDVWKDSGKLIDLTKYFDMSNGGIKGVDLPSEINMTYAKPKAANNKYFLDYNGYAYGDRVNKETGGEGAAYSIKVGFENLLWDNLTGDDILVGKSVEGSEGSTELKAIQDKAYLFFWSGTQSGVVVDANFANPVNSYKLCSSFYPLANPTETLNFGSEVNPYDNILDDTLSRYNSYYFNFLDNKFDRQHRIYNFEAVLPAAVLNSVGISALEAGEVMSTESIELNDVVRIKDKYYNIEEMKVTLNTRVTKVVLSNIKIDESKFDDGVDREPPTAPVLYSVPNPGVDAPIIGVLTVGTETSSEIPLTWTAATDDGTITNYEIYMDGVSKIVLGNVLLTTISGLSQLTSYTFKIRAKDNLGNWSDFSDEVVGTTIKTLGASTINSSPTTTWKDSIPGQTFTLTATNSPNMFRTSTLPFWMLFDSSLGKFFDDEYPFGSDDSPVVLTVAASNDYGLTWGADSTLTITINS